VTSVEFSADVRKPPRSPRNLRDLRGKSGIMNDIKSIANHTKALKTRLS
jgi:hypothetical protein